MREMKREKTRGRRPESYLLLFMMLLMLSFLPACGSSSETASADAVSTEAGEQAEEQTEEKSVDLKNLAAAAGVNTSEKETEEAGSVSLEEIPAYSGSPYVEINDNVPFFTDAEMTESAFEEYSSLDSLGRCGVAYANVCQELMPTEERGEIGAIKPSGWHTVKYDSVSGKYLYNRCHLIGYQLTAENANEKNLITGTRYLNVEGMLPFENMVADYVEETNNHVLYRVTPMFEGENLLASGVLMEAKSVEDDGAGILFNVYCYNVQPGISINYANGESAEEGGSTEATAEESTGGRLGAADEASSGSSVGETRAAGIGAAAAASTAESEESTAESSQDSNQETIVHITDTGKKYHRAGCRTLKSDHEVTLEEAKAQGLEPCKVCNPPK